jgi:WD40 repeat protein
MRYDAFISYSHAADHRLAPELQKGLQQLARAWYKPRALRVFRDRSSLAVTPALWPAIERALEDSRYFIFLASPEAAASEWVEREIRWWLERRAANSLLVVLTGGELDWDDASNRFSVARSTALPEALTAAFPEEPRYLDLRWARTRDQVSMRVPVFRDNVAEIAATLHGKPKDELEGDDVRQHRRTRRIAWSAALLLVALTIASIVGATIAVRQRNLASERGQIALARQLAAQASVIVAESPDRLPLALALATEALSRHSSAETQRALRSLLALRPGPLLTLQTFASPVALEFSPDGRRFALATDDGWAAAWNAPDSATAFGSAAPPDTTPAWIVDTGAPVTALAFTPDGRFVAVAAGTAALLLDAGSGQRVLQLDAPDTVRALAVSPRRDRLATAAVDGSITLWSLDGRELSRFDTGDEVSAIAFAPDGERLAWINRGGGLCLAITGEAAAEPFCRFTRGEGLDLAWLPDANRIVSVSENFAQLWDTQSAAPLTRMEHADAAGDADMAHFNWIRGVAVSPDGRRIATAGGIDFSVRVWDTESGEELRRMHHAAMLLGVRYSPSGDLLASISGDGTVGVWDPVRGVERLRGTHLNSVNVIAFDPAGRRLLSGSFGGDVTMWDLSAGDEVRRVSHSSQIVELAVNADGSRVATLNREGWVDVSDGSGVRVGRVHAGYQMRRLLFLTGDTLLAWRSEDPHWIDLTAPGEFTVRPVVAEGTDVFAFSSLHLLAEDGATDSLFVLSARTGEVLLRLGPPASFREAALSRDGRLLVMEQPEQYITVLDLPSGTQRIRFPAGAPVTDLRVSNDGGHVAALMGDALRSWAVRGSTIRLGVSDTTASFNAIIVNRDGSRVIGRTDEELRVYDGRTGRLLARRSHPQLISRIRFDPSEQYLAAMTSSEVRVLETATLELIAEFAGPVQYVDAAFTSDGRQFVTADDDGNITVRYWQTEDMLRRACARTSLLTRPEWEAWLGSVRYDPWCARARY